MQYKLWFGDGSVSEVLDLRCTLDVLENKNYQVKHRNAVLEADVENLKTGLDAIEERARSELGMVKEDETFIHIIENKPKEIANK